MRRVPCPTCVQPSREQGAALPSSSLASTSARLPRSVSDTTNARSSVALLMSQGAARFSNTCALGGWVSGRVGGGWVGGVGG